MGIRERWKMGIVIKEMEIGNFQGGEPEGEKEGGGCCCGREKMDTTATDSEFSLIERVEMKEKKWDGLK